MWNFRNFVSKTNCLNFWGIIYSNKTILSAMISRWYFWLVFFLVSIWRWKSRWRYRRTVFRFNFLSERSWFISRFTFVHFKLWKRFYRTRRIYIFPYCCIWNCFSQKAFTIFFRIFIVLRLLSTFISEILKIPCLEYLMWTIISTTFVISFNLPFLFLISLEWCLRGISYFSLYWGSKGTIFFPSLKFWSYIVWSICR